MLVTALDTVGSSTHPQISDVVAGDVFVSDVQRAATTVSRTVDNGRGQQLSRATRQAGIAVYTGDPPTEDKTVSETVLGAVSTQAVLKTEPELVCTYTEAGICSVHGQAKKRIRPGKTWKRGKNGLYGWRYTSTVYYTCTGLPKSTHNTDEPVPTFLVLPVNSATFGNFTEPGGRVSRTAGHTGTSKGMKSTGEGGR